MPIIVKPAPELNKTMSLRGESIDDNDSNESKPIPVQSNENTESSIEEKPLSHKHR